MGKIFLVASGKGGVGKTIFTSNMGATFAERGAKVALVDMNVGLRNLDIYMGLQDKVIFDVADVTDGVVQPKRALIKDKRFQGLYMIATTQKKEKFKATEPDIKMLYDYLRKSFDFIIVDGPAGIGQDLLLAACDVDMAVVITTPEYVSLRDADMVEQTLRRNGLGNRVYVVNKYHKDFMSSGILPTVETITSTMKIPLLGVIQHDDAIHLAANSGVPVVYQNDNYIERNFSKMADRLLKY